MTNKLKSWRYIGAEPSEYLVCTRGGQVDRDRSGQGMRIFKWPWLSVSIVPTTLQRIEFTADQITRERVGVSVSGIAVYRIAEPLLAFRVLDFTSDDARDKLAATLREMFIGAARRLVANLSLDDCLTRRKEAIAGYLMDEIAPVVSGTGAPYDTTEKGWGVVLDTIEIQQVQIQSAQVFAHLQAPYRAEIATRAELADLERKRQVYEIESREAARRALQEIETAQTALEAERVLREARHAQAELELAQQRALDEAKQAAEITRHRAQADLSIEMRRRDAEMKDQEGQLEAAQQLRLAEVEKLLAQTRVLHSLVTQGLPKIAEAMAQTYGTVNYTQIGSAAAGGPFDAVPAAFAQLLALARSFGVELPVRSDS